tara:strand:+ start:507 stop:701 length:195 start_codon:yes stop_codon:yes gene_type:complete
MTGLPEIDVQASVRRAVKAWPDEWRDAWAERAAIIEFDAHEPREKAEFFAYWQTRRRKEAGDGA